MEKPSKKRLLNELEKQECSALNAIYKAKKKALGITQEQIAIEGLRANTQSAASHYLTGKNSLNIEAAAVFARYLQEPIESFSPRLAADISAMASAVNQPSKNDEATAGSDLVEEHAAWLADIATPRSREVLARIANAARSGRLTDDDLNLLDQIAARFEARSPAQGSAAQGSHKRLRDRLQKNDPNPQ